MKYLYFENSIFFQKSLSSSLKSILALGYVVP